MSILLCSIELGGCANNASVKESSKTSVSDDTTVADTFTGASEGKYFYKDSASQKGPFLMLLDITHSLLPITFRFFFSQCTCC